MTASDKGPVKVGEAFADRIIGAAMSELPKERWSCSDDASGTAITLARQRHWSATEVRKVLDASTDQQALVAELVEALEPFAKAHGTVAALDHSDPRWPDESTIDWCDNVGFAEHVTIGDLRRARALLAKVRGGERR